uniref:Caspase domain-containing protein n=1 Tax=Candidatus Kentrum sp. FW TaxID=2126338 RepID=A0A450SXK5_9GAMM|nr:MAG: Caspase domain-containing protein [Candidatus Kentron sp. FW]VFJ58825.1 MAG: Caspase domain-containing protein [Candidatus Kentron sp. FW]
MRKTAIIYVFLLLGLLYPQAFAADGRGMVHVMTNDGHKLPLYGKSYALLIGVSDYDTGTGWSDLVSVPRELDRLEKMLKHQGFAIVRVNNPDDERLVSAFRDFTGKYGYDETNRLLFFFSGHGYTRNNKGYLVPRNASHPGRGERGFLRKALPIMDILALSRRIEARHALFLFDSSFSSTVFEAKRVPRTPPRITARTTHKVRQFITAGNAGEEVPNKSTFTPALVDGISQGKADLNSDGYVTGMELGMYLQSEVPKYTNQIPQFGKSQDYELAQGDFVFVLGRPALVMPRKLEKTSSADHAIELEFWDSIRQSDDPDMYRAYLKQYPNGSFAALAKIKIKKLESR